MDTIWIRLSIILSLSTGLQRVLAFTSTLTVSPSTPVIGSGYSVNCAFTIETNEIFQTLDLFIGTSTDENKIVTLSTVLGFPVWTGNSKSVDEMSRAHLNGSKDLGYVTVNYSRTECFDDARPFISKFVYYKNVSVHYPDASTQTVLVQANPAVPDPMVVEPNSQNLTENTPVKFTCYANVGRKLPGSNTDIQRRFRWFKYINNSGQEVTSQVTNERPVLAADNCTYNLKSILPLTLDATEEGGPLVVRCVVDEGVVTVDSPCTNPSTHLCRMSQQISVQYLVQVQIGGSCTDPCVKPEGSFVNLRCISRGNPKPHLTEWRRESTLIASVSEYNISRISLENTGTYRCTSYNIVAGILVNASASISITVVPTTTPPPTTTTTPRPTTTSLTMEGEKFDSTSPDTSGASSQDIVAIVVPVVVGGVALFVIIIVIIVVVRRKKMTKAPEEPPDKPFNNNASINSITARPDLVSNDKAAFHSYDVNKYRNEDGLSYAELQLDNKPRSRRGLAIDDSNTDYSDVSMPQV